jgi:hypothetical protein
MKNKWFLILGILLVLSFVLAGCDNGNGSKNTEPKTIVINDITDYTGEARISVFNNLNTITNHRPVNAGIGSASISNSSLSVDLKIPENNTSQTSTSWTESGSYYIYFEPRIDNSYSTTNGRIYMGSGSEPLRLNINQAVTTVSYNDFKKRNIWKD